MKPLAMSGLLEHPDRISVDMQRASRSVLDRHRLDVAAVRTRRQDDGAPTGW